MKHATMLAAALVLTSGAAQALSLGEVGGRAVLGQPLALTIPVLGEDAAALRADCIFLLASAEIPSDGWIEASTWRVERGQLSITSRRPVSQPILGFRLSVGCGFNLTRDYQVLPQLPQLAPPPAPAAPAPIPSAVGGGVATPPIAAEGDHIVTARTTLRLMSRQRHPQDSKARVAFIRRVAAANPAVFANVAGAFDQDLPAGTVLRIPAEPPRSEAAAAMPAPARPAPPPPRARRDKLMVGAAAVTNRKVEELESDLERLAGLMNEQVQVQMTMARRLAALDAEIAEAKQALLARQEESRKLAAELRQLRAEQERDGYIQLALGILLLGVSIGGVLLWRENARVRARAEADTASAFPFAPASPAPAPVAATAAVAAASVDFDLPSLFDEPPPPPQ